MSRLFTKLIHLMAGLVLVLGFAASANAAAKKKGLLILMENGGILGSLRTVPALQGKTSDAKLPLASCGTLRFALNPGESTTRMIARLSGVIGKNTRCLNPRAWRVRQVGFDTFINAHSDVMLEEIVKAVAMVQNTKDIYDRVVLLEDERMTPALALSSLRRMAKTHVVDIHVLSHGDNNHFIGGKPRGSKSAAKFGGEFFDALGKIRSLELGAVYQMNCVSGTLLDEWQKAGAKVVNGTVGKKNNYMPQQYFHFLHHWVGGAQFGTAVRKSYTESSLYTLPAYRAFGVAEFVTDSRHVVKGNAALRARSHEKVGYVVGRVTVKTAVQLANDLRAQGKTIQQMVQALTAAGHSLLETTRAVVSATNCNTRELVEGLLAAGHSASDVIPVVKSALGGNLNETQLCQALLSSGKTATEVATLLKSNFNKNRDAVATLLKASGCNANQVARALKDATAATTAQIADSLKTVGFSARAIGRALKNELSVAHAQAAQALRSAGVKVADIIVVLRSEYKCGLTTIAKDLKQVGLGFNAVAKALWDSTKKTASNFNSVRNALASAFSMNIAQVLSSLAKLNIQA